MTSKADALAWAKEELKYQRQVWTTASEPQWHTSPDTLTRLRQRVECLAYIVDYMERTS